MGLLSTLKVHAHIDTKTYKRAKFKLWIDPNHDCKSTRADVLVRASTKSVTENKYCTVETGEWTSPYDGKKYTKASKLQIDHLVPLENAWISGASKWTAQRREAYANDLGYSYALIAVSVHANESKGDDDPSRYLPPKKSYDCRYVESWIGVKYRWALTVTAHEKAVLKADLGKYCKSVKIGRPAKPNLRALIGSVTPATTPSPTVAPVVTPSASAAPVVTPSPSPTSDVYYGDCAAAWAAGAAPLYFGQPGYRPDLDSDADGVACEDNPNPSTTPSPSVTPIAPGAPAGATAICRDGTYSYSTSRSGTCSGHGGVAQWL